MKSITKLVGCCCLIALLTGCASIMCGPRQTVAINSKPEGAEVLVYDSCGEIVFQKTTPCVAELDRRTCDYEGGHYVVLIRKEGYSPVQIPLTGKVNRAYFANIVNVVGLIIDPITGSMWTLTPNEVSAKLVSENAALFNHDGGLMICLKEEVPQDLLPYLKPVQN